MSLQQIIEDLKAMGEVEAATKLLFMKSGIIKAPDSFCDSPTATDVSEILIWAESVEGFNYWEGIYDKHLKYKRSRSRS